MSGAAGSCELKQNRFIPLGAPGRSADSS